MFKPKPESREERFKTIKVITEEQEHVCTEKCFETRRKRKPRGLRRVDLGHVYQDSQGRVYSERDKDWLEVIGINFLQGPGGLCLAFVPKEQLHIHSRGGRTTAITTERQDDPAGIPYEYHAGAAATILRDDEHKNLRQASEILRAEAAKVIPRAAKKKKPSSGRGKGAPGEPRSPRGRVIVDLINKGFTRAEVMAKTLAWAKENHQSVAGPHGRAIKLQVAKWWALKKVAP